MNKDITTLPRGDHIQAHLSLPLLNDREGEGAEKSCRRGCADRELRCSELGWVSRKKQ